VSKSKIVLKGFHAKAQSRKEEYKKILGKED